MANIDLAAARNDAVLQACIRGWKELVAVEIHNTVAAMSGREWYRAWAGSIAENRRRQPRLMLDPKTYGVGSRMHIAIHEALDNMGVPKAIHR